MSAGAIAGTIIGVAAALFIAAMIIRTVLAKPSKDDAADAEVQEKIDKDAAVAHLREAVRIRTVSMAEEYADNSAPFDEYHEWLKDTYPLLHARAERTVIAGYSLIYKIPGLDSSLKGGCFLSHMDVVPAPAAGWDYNPFGGELTEDGYIYGRGSQDMKGHMIALLEAVEHCLASGAAFKRDLYLCFGHDEEPSNVNVGASSVVRYLKAQNVKLEFVVDEGGTMLDGNILGIPHTVALVGASEKGNGDFEIVVNKQGGHASSPKPPTAVGVLAEAVNKIEKNPMRARWTNLSKEMFKSLAPYAKPAFRFIFVNRNVFGPLLKFVLSVAAPMTNALMRTTFAPTMLWGSDARNVLPREVKANVNFRMLTGETADSVKAYVEKLLKKRVDRGEIEIRLLEYTDPSPEADVNSEAYKNIKLAIEQSYEGIVVAPYPFIAASDARFYYPLTTNVFRFGPFINSLDDQARIHGVNERLHVDQLETAVQFFVRCLKTTLN